MKMFAVASTFFCRSRSLIVSGLFVLGACLGCGLELGEPSSTNQQKNSCDDDDACKGGTFCGRGICQRATTELPSFLLATTAPSGAAPITGFTFFEVVDRVSRDDQLDIDLSGASEVHVAVRARPIEVDEMCVPDPDTGESTVKNDGTIPARITLTPRTRLLGLPHPPIIKQSLDEAQVGQVDSFEFVVFATPGNYDVYVEPLGTEGGCVRPPVLFLDQFLPADIQPLPIELPAPQVLGVTVRYPRKSDDLSGWRMSIVERDSGRLLSNEATLGDPEETEGGFDYQVKLAFSQIRSDVGDLAAEIVRLAPPPEVVAPVIHIERSILDLFQNGQGLIDQLTQLPGPVDFRARVVLAGVAEGTPASVQFIATQLVGIPPGTVAGFSSVVETAAAGEFEVQLLPGAYRVRVVPADENLAALESEVVVSDTSMSQHGRTLEVTRRRTITGRLRTFANDTVSGISLSALPTAVRSPTNVLSLAQGQQLFLPSSVGDVSGPDGHFMLLADEGSFTLSARPQSGSGYAWYVQQSVQANADEVILGDVRLPPPVVVDGAVADPSGTPLSDALVRAYAFVSEGKLVGRAAGEPNDRNQPPLEADSVIQVAEARSDEEGRYRLLLPASFK